MTHADIHVHAIRYEDTPSDLPRYAWAGPAIGASVLTVAYAMYFVPVFLGILSTVYLP